MTNQTPSNMPQNPVAAGVRPATALVREPATKQDPVGAMLQSPGVLQELAKALPRHLTAERFARIALTEIRNSKTDLPKCTPASIMSCLVQSAQLGLEPGLLGEAYLIPFRNNRTNEFECTLVPGYKGLVKLARNSGNVKKIESILVYDGDEFGIRYGLSPDIHHIPHAIMNGTARDAAVTHAYAYVAYKDGTHQFEVMTRPQIDAIRDRGRRNPVWNEHYSEMARKTVLRRLCKHIQLSPELTDALTLDAEADEILELPARPQPDRYKQLVDLDRQEEAEAREQRLKLAAVADFDAACAEAKGIDIEKALGVSYDQAMGESSAFLEAAAEKLRGMKK